MYDRAQMQALAAVLAEGSFEAAARVIGVTPSAISQRIRALEEAAGAALVLRRTPVEATGLGARIARHAEDLALLDAALAADLGRPAPDRPRLRITVNADSLATWFPAALARMAGEALYDLEIDDQDHAGDWLRAGAVQAAVTGEGRALPGADVHPLGHMRYLATASPGFAARWFPDGVTVEALAAAPALRFNDKDRLQHNWAQEETGVEVALPCHRVGSSTAFVALAERGIGWGVNPEPLVRDALAAGRLVTLGGGRPLDVALYWHAARLPGAALAPLTRAVRAEARVALRPAGD